MTGKQQRMLLLTEGMYYAGISLFLTATVGLGILYLKNDNLIKQRDLLLPRLMSGKLEVK